MSLAPGQIARVVDVEHVVKGVRITNTGNPIATTSGTTELDLTKWALTGLSLEDGRYYLYRAVVTYTKTQSSDTFELRLRANTALSGTVIGHSPVPFGAGLTAGWTVLDMLLVGNSSWTSLHLSVVRTSGTGTLSYFGATGSNINRAWAALLNMGDTNWTDVA